MRYLETFMKIPEIRNEGVHIPEQNYRKNFDNTAAALQNLADRYLHAMVQCAKPESDTEIKEYVRTAMRIAEEFIHYKTNYLSKAVDQFEEALKEKTSKGNPRDGGGHSSKAKAER